MEARVRRFQSYPTAPTELSSASSTNPNTHFKAGKQDSLLNHNRNFAAHSLFIASINMEKPCLNSGVRGSLLMLTMIMVILVPGIIGRAHLSETHTLILGNGDRAVVKRLQWLQTMSLKAFGLRCSRPFVSDPGQEEQTEQQWQETLCYRRRRSIASKVG